MLSFFTDWAVKEAAFYSQSVTKDANGRPSVSWTLEGTLSVNWWVTRAIETNQNDKFVGKKTGKIALDPQSFSIDTTYKAVIDGNDYFITGVDNIGGLDEVWLLEWSTADE